MIDFWELAGRLLLMDPATRNKEIYSDGGLLPIQSNDCILLGHADTPTLPFTKEEFYDPMRNYFAAKYTGNNRLLSPVISMFALGETGTMFFNPPFRVLFEKLSGYLLNGSVVNNRRDTGSDSMFYIVLTIIALDKTSRESVINDNFLGLEPSSEDRVVLRRLAADPGFQDVADKWCFGGDWTEGSHGSLRYQKYGNNPLRHVRFIHLP